MSYLRHACQTANQGLAFACEQAGVASPAVMMPTASVIGFTAPTLTYQRMRLLQADAARLDANVQAYVNKGSPFYAAWTAWYRDNWTPFYEKYADHEDYSTWSRLTAAFNSDELAAQAQRYQNQFDALLSQYNTQPGAPRVNPTTPPDPQKTSSFFALPWWFWVGATVAVGGAGYLVYRKVQQAQRAGKYLREHPEVLGAVAGPEAAAALRLQNAIDSSG